jgi:hypothetical protein
VVRVIRYPDFPNARRVDLQNLAEAAGRGSDLRILHLYAPSNTPRRDPALPLGSQELIALIGSAFVGRFSAVSLS